nr:hypothetical protein [Tanacetum cinerariifolium]
SNVREARNTCSDLEESKNYTWFSKGQRMEATGIMWCAYHNFYIYSADFVSGDEIHSTTSSRRPAKMMVEYILHQAQEQELDQLWSQCCHRLEEKHDKCLMLLVKDLMLSSKVDDCCLLHMIAAAVIYFMLLLIRDVNAAMLSPTKPAQYLSHTNRPTTPIIEDRVSDSKDEFKTRAPQIVPSFVQTTKQMKSPSHSVQHVETSVPAATPNPASLKPASSGKRRNRNACFVCKSMDHLIKDFDYHTQKMAQPTTRNHAHRGNHKHYAPMTYQNPQQHMVFAAVLTQSQPVSVTVVRPVSVVVPKSKVTRPRHATPIVTKPKSPIRRHLTCSPSPKTSNLPPRVTAVKALVVSVAQGVKGKWE